MRYLYGCECVCHYWNLVHTFIYNPMWTYVLFKCQSNVDLLVVIALPIPNQCYPLHFVCRRHPAYRRRHRHTLNRHRIFRPNRLMNRVLDKLKILFITLIIINNRFRYRGKNTVNMMMFSLAVRTINSRTSDGTNFRNGRSHGCTFQWCVDKRFCNNKRLWSCGLFENERNKSVCHIFHRPDFFERFCEENLTWKINRWSLWGILVSIYM